MGGGGEGGGGGGGGGHSPSQPGWYETTTPEERMAFFKENPTLGSITAWMNENAGNMPYIGGMIDSGLANQYAQEARGTYGRDSSYSGGERDSYSGNYDGSTPRGDN